MTIVWERNSELLKYLAMKLFFASALSLFILSSCGPIVDVPKVEEKPFLAVPQDAKPSPIGLNTIRLAIPRGMTIGAYNPGWDCTLPWGELSSREITRHLERPEMRRTFNQALEAQGYDITARGDILFDEEDEYARTLYSIGGRIVDIKWGCVIAAPPHAFW